MNPPGRRSPSSICSWRQFSRQVNPALICLGSICRTPESPLGCCCRHLPPSPPRPLFLSQERQREEMIGVRNGPQQHSRHFISNLKFSFKNSRLIFKTSASLLIDSRSNRLSQTSPNQSQSFLCGGPLGVESGGRGTLYHLPRGRRSHTIALRENGPYFPAWGRGRCTSRLSIQCRIES